MGGGGAQRSFAFYVRLGFAGETAQLARNAGEPGDKFTTVRQECDCKEGDILFECNGVHGRLDLMVSYLSGVCNSLTAARERLENVVDVRPLTSCGLRH